MSDKESVRCHFSSKDGQEPKRPACEGDASGFVRVEKTGRLCPLCPSCMKNFVEIMENMSKRSTPDYGPDSFKQVSMDEGRAEFAAQPPRDP
jgi:hypothetical protein